MEIVYYGLNKAYVEQAQDWLGAVNQHPTFNHAGSEAMVITLKEQGITPENALALSFPFAVLFQFVTTFLYTFFAGNPK